jgi:hypothetical protein
VSPALGVDASRVEAPTTTFAIPPPPETTPSGPADPPPPGEPPPLPLRPARLDVDFPDPSVVWGDDLWYAFSTNSGSRNVQVSTSSDLFAWTAPGEAVPTLPPWSQPGYTWAPAVAKIGNQWVMYVSIVHGFTGTHCIDRLVAATARGPYAPVDGGPLVCDQTGGNGSIDPSVFVAGGVPYLYWKADGARSQQLFGVALTPDGMAFVGQPQHLLTATAAWQQSGIENPSMIAGAGEDWLVYSGAFWATGRYAMGYARCSGPLGPCRETSADGPWVATSGNVVGPGGGSMFRGPDGVQRLAFHAWAGTPGYAAGGRRVLHIERVDIGPSGPSILDLPPTGTMALVIGPEGVSVRGSAVDPDTRAAVGVTVFIDGKDRGSTLAGPGFGVDLATPADGPHRACVVAVDDLEQSRPEIGCQDFTITSLPFGALDAASPAVTGWAIAPSTSGSIAVDIYVDGQYVTSTPADLQRDDVAAYWPAYGNAHGFSVAVPATGAGPHSICAYGIVDDNQPAPQLGCITVA